jgi:4'-phosphopantetheinyl transferase EntD
VFELILPSAVASATRREDDADEAVFPGEEAAIENAVEKRRREFVTGRACARAALAQLGLPPQAVPSGSRGAPQWPDGIVGSITHCEGLRACAAARSTDLVTVGIDAERDEPLPEGVLRDIALPEERTMLRDLARERSGLNWDRLLFSAKETVYKAWYPLAESWLGFEDAIVSIDPAGAYSVRLLIPGPTVGGRVLTGFTGRWAAEEGFLLTAIARGTDEVAPPAF